MMSQTVTLLPHPLLTWLPPLAPASSRQCLRRPPQVTMEQRELTERPRWVTWLLESRWSPGSSRAASMPA